MRTTIEDSRTQEEMDNTQGFVMFEDDNFSGWGPCSGKAYGIFCFMNDAQKEVLLANALSGKLIGVVAVHVVEKLPEWRAGDVYSIHGPASSPWYETLSDEQIERMNVVAERAQRRKKLWQETSPEAREILSALGII